MEPQRRETYRNTLKRALAIAGSADALAARLKVSRAQLQHWLDGAEPIPIPSFLDAVDMVIGPGATLRAPDPRPIAKPDTRSDRK